MHALLFEMRPHPGHLDFYFEHVARLRPVLARHTGLTFLDRYTSLTEPDLLLSHQVWDSEDAIAAWRADASHRRSQAAGRQVHFADYRIRVGKRVLHWLACAERPVTDPDGASKQPHVLALYSGRAIDAPGTEGFQSMNHPGHYIALATCDDFAKAEAMLRALVGVPGLEQAAIYRIDRDYGLNDRAQAPA